MKIIGSLPSSKSWDLKFDKATRLPVGGYYRHYYNQANDPTSQYTQEYGFTPIFEAVLTPSGFGRGQSSVTQKFKTVEGAEYSMAAKFTHVLLDLIADGTIPVTKNALGDPGFLVRFKFTKQGENVYLEPFYNRKFKPWE